MHISLHVKKSADFSRVLVPSQTIVDCVYCSMLAMSLCRSLNISLAPMIVKDDRGFLGSMKTPCFAGLTDFCLFSHKSLTPCPEKAVKCNPQCIPALQLSPRWEPQQMWHWPWPGYGPDTESGLPNFRRGVTVPSPLHSFVEKWRNSAKVQDVTLDNASPAKNYFSSFYEVENMKSSQWKDHLGRDVLGDEGLLNLPYEAAGPFFSSFLLPFTSSGF